MGLLKTELEKVKEEKEGFEFKIVKFEKSSKDLDDLLASQVTDKSKKGFGYNVVPSPHPLILNRPTPLDLSYIGLEEFKQPEVDKDWKEKFFHLANHIRVEEPKKARENTAAPIIEYWVSDDEEEVEPIPKVEKKTAIPTATKKELVKPEKPVRRSVRYAEMYRSQGPRGNQRNWNGQKSNQLGCNFMFNNKACFNNGSFDHIQYSCPKHMAPRAVLMKTGLKIVNNARPVNTIRSINTGRPFSTARSFNTVRPSYTAHPKSTIHCARPRTYFQNQAQSTVHRPFYKKTALTNRCLNKRFNTGSTNSISTVSSTVNTVRERGFNAVKPLACWIWRPIKPNGASLVFNKYNYIDARDRSKSVMAWNYWQSDYAGATQDRKSTTGGCQFLGNRLISWQCKKQTVVATSTTKAEYVAAASCCGQDASYFDDASPRSVADAQIQDQNGLHDEIDDLEKTHDDSSLQNNGTADQQVNTARPEVNTGSREVSIAVLEVNTAIPEDLVGPSPTSEDSHMENQEIKLGNIPQSYEVPTTPHTRIHKDHPIEHVIGDVQSSVQTRRMKTSYSENRSELDVNQLKKEIIDSK
ncbi:hypothetical protein Tco_1374443 [Tanacetum coccineum]